MAPVRKSSVGQGSSYRSSASIVGMGVVQRELNGDIEFSYAEAAAESGAYRSRGTAESASDRFEGRALPGLSTEYLDEHENAINSETPPVFRAAATPFSNAGSSAGGGFGAAAFNAAGGGAGTFHQENIIGPVDSRERVTTTSTDPYKWICLLEMVSPNGSLLMGTGWLCGNSTLVTAGHCVYNRSASGGLGAMRSIKVYAGRNKLDSQGTASAVSTNTTKEWVNSGSTQYDYAAIQLDQPLGQNLKFFQFADFPDSDLQNLLVNITGYPGDKNRGAFYGTMWGSTNRIVSVAAQQLGYVVDTMGGQSGSPVIAFDGTTAYATGIHNYGGATSNTATRINSQVFDKITSWVK